jgi:predicted membrane GTPase involved in stress response
MNYECPIELLAKSSRTRFQAGFAKMTTFLLPDLDGVLFEPTSEGLRIMAANEAALELPVKLLRDIHGDDLELGTPRARLICGDDVREPVMSLHAIVASEHVEAVLGDLTRRGALVQEADRRESQCVLRAQARLAVLLGYQKDLAAMTNGTAALSMQLSHYEAIAQHPAMWRSGG